jgi:hypothetical protein
MLEQPERPAIEIIRGNYLSAPVEAFEHGGDRRHSGGKGKSGAAVFEIGDTTLQRLSRGIGVLAYA